MREARLDTVISGLPSGVPVPVACWLIGRVANALVARPRPISPKDIIVGEDGSVRVAPPEGTVPFAYRAPEVIRGGDGDVRAAVFSLGAILIECFTCRSPFERGSAMETRLAVAEEEVPRLVGRVAQASAALDAIVRRATAKRAAERYASTAELGEQLDRFLEDELHEVGPPELAATVRAALTHGDVRAELEGAIPERPLATPPPPPPSTPPPTALDYAEAELDLSPNARRTSAPNKPRLDQELVRIGDPHSTEAGAGITEASVTGVRASGPKLPRPAVGALDIDERMVERDRDRQPRTLASAPEELPAPNWLLRGTLIALGLLVASIAYAYVIRPLLSD